MELNLPPVEILPHGDIFLADAKNGNNGNRVIQLDILGIEHDDLVRKAGRDGNDADLQALVDSKKPENKYLVDFKSTYYELEIKEFKVAHPLGSMHDGYKIIKSDGKYSDFNIELLDKSFTEYYERSSGKITEEKTDVKNALVGESTGVRITVQDFSSSTKLTLSQITPIIDFKGFYHTKLSSYTDDITTVIKASNILDAIDNVYRFPHAYDNTLWFKPVELQMNIMIDNNIKSKLEEDRKQIDNELKNLMFEEAAFGTGLKYCTLKNSTQTINGACVPSTLMSLGYAQDFVIAELGMADFTSGCSVSKLIEFCLKHNHSYYIVDQNYSPYKFEIGSDPTNKKCLMIMLASNHIEIIEDNHIRNTIRERCKNDTTLKGEVKKTIKKCKSCDFTTESQTLLFIHIMETHNDQIATDEIHDIKVILDFIEHAGSMNIKTSLSIMRIWVRAIRELKLVGKLHFKSNKADSVYFADRNIYISFTGNHNEIKAAKDLGLQYNQQSLGSLATEYINTNIEVDYKSFINEHMKILERSPVAAVGNFQELVTSEEKITEETKLQKQSILESQSNDLTNLAIKECNNRGINLNKSEIEKLKTQTVLNNDFTKLSQFVSNKISEVESKVFGTKIDNAITELEEMVDESFKQIDITKCYPSIIIAHDMPKVSPISYFEQYKQAPIIDTYFYLHDKRPTTIDEILLLDHPYLTGYTVKYAIEQKLLEQKNITAVCKTTSIPSKHLRKIFTDFFLKTDEGKKLANFANGCFKGSEKTSYSNPIITTSIAEAIYHRNAKSSHLSMIDKDIWLVMQKETIKRFSNGIPIYNTVVELGRLKLYKLKKFIESFGGMPIQAKTDCIVFKSDLSDADINAKIAEFNKTIPNLDSKEFSESDYKKIQEVNFGKLKPVESVSMEKVFRYSEVIKSRYEQYIPDYWAKQPRITKLRDDEDYDLEHLKNIIREKKSCAFSGDGGVGKSRIVKNTTKWMDDEKIGYKIAAFTNTAANNVNGETLHHIFKISVVNKQILDSELNKFVHGISVLIIDEVGMIPSYLYSVLKMLKSKKPELSIIMFGDWYQIKPVGEEHLEFEHNPVVQDLHGWETIALEKNYRLLNAKNPVSAKKFRDYNRSCVRNEREYKMTDLGKDRVIGYASEQMFETDINLVYTNAMRREINKMYQERELKKNPEMKIFTKRLDDGKDTKFETFNMYKNMPVVAMKTRWGKEVFNPSDFKFDMINETVERINKPDESITIFKNEHYLIEDIDDKKITIVTNANLAYCDLFGVPIIKRITLDNDNSINSLFEPGYAFTVHKTQSLSIPTKFNIHEFDKMKRRADGRHLIYTALGRCTDPADIRIVFVGSTKVVEEETPMIENEQFHLANGLEIVKTVCFGKHTMTATDIAMLNDDMMF